MRARNRKFLAYLAAPALVGAAIALRSAVLGSTGGPEPDLLLSAVAIAGALGGFGPAAVATAVGLVEEIYFQTEPVRTFLVPKHRDQVELAIFLVSGIAIGVTFEFLRRLRRREAAVRRTLLMITQCNEAILRARAEEQLYADICRVIVDVGGYRMCWVGLAERDDRKTVRPVSHAGHEDGYLGFVDVVWADEPRGRGTTGTAIRERRMVVGQNFSTDSSMVPWRREARRRGYRSVTSLPLILDGDVLGAIVMYSGDVAAFTEDELGYLGRLTDEVAFGVGAIRQRQARDRAVAEKDEAVQQRKERERFLDMVLATSLDAFWVVDNTGQLLEANDAACSMLGFTREELLARGIGDVEEAMGAEEIADRMQEMVRAGGARFESRHRRRDGRIIEVDVSATVLPFGGGRVVAFIRDITERRRAERTLQASQERLQEAQRLAHLGNWELDLQTGVLSWSEEIFRIFEIDPARFGASYEAFLAAIHPGDRAAVDAAYQRSLETRAPYEITHRLLLPDGRVKFVQENCETFYGPDGTSLRSLGTVQDVTERKQAEAAVRASEALLRAIANSSPDSIFAKDREGRWTFANTAALQVAGKPADEVLGRSDAEIMGDVALVRTLASNDREVLETGTARSFEEVVDTPTGMRRFLSTKAPLRDPAGHVVGIAGVAKDVTEIRKLQDQIAVASRLAAMGTLVAGVSHEVNSPLAGVLAGAGVASEDVKEARRLLDEDTPTSRAETARLLDEGLDSLADVQAGSQRIAQIVKDLALFARPDPLRARVRIIEVVSQAMRWLPASVGTTVTLRVEDRGAPDILASFGQIGQVLVNLVTNAAKAMPRGRKGEVVVRLGPGSPGMARIEVIDHGVGMAPDVVERIFDPFFTTRAAGEGTGLGLPIIHAIVTAHGGTITVESEVGMGSTFRVELPAAPAEA